MPIIFKMFNARSQTLKSRSVFTCTSCSASGCFCTDLSPQCWVLPVHCGSRSVFCWSSSALGRVERSAALALSLGSVSVSPCSCSEWSFSWMMVMVENGHDMHLYGCSPATQTHAAALTQTQHVFLNRFGSQYTFISLIGNVCDVWLICSVSVWMMSLAHVRFISPRPSLTVCLKRLRRAGDREQERGLMGNGEQKDGARFLSLCPSVTFTVQREKHC